MHLASLRDARYRQPFVPFDLVLVNSRHLKVPHPDFIALGRRRVAYFDPETDALSILDPMMIVSLEYPAGTTIPPTAALPDSENEP